LATRKRAALEVKTTTIKAPVAAGASGEDLRVPKLSHMVAANLRAQIASGKLATGSVLQPENKLLELFNISRPTLREALRILEAESLISIGRGMRAGAVVLGPNLRKAAEYTNFMMVAEGVTMRDLHQARMFFEPPILSSLTAANLKNAVAALRGCVNLIEDSLSRNDYVGVVAGTNQFHENLAKASGNRAVGLVIGVLQSISDDAYAAILSKDEGLSAPDENLQKNMQKTVTGYSALCDLLEKGKPEEAAKFWARYMQRALDFLDRSRLGERRLVQAGIAPAGAREAN
jgi:DNA-binding FadR family transcriptional regulator